MNRRDRRRAPHGSTSSSGDPRITELRRAHALVVDERFAEAEAACRRLLGRDRSLTDAHWLLARALRGQGRLDEAMLAARRAATSGPESAAAHTELGAVLTAQDRHGEAIRALERALEIDPDHVDAHNRYGLVMLETGFLDEALASFRRVAELLPDDPSHHANIAATLARMGDFQAALEAYDAGLDAFPESDALRYSRCFPRLALGDLEGGWDDQEYGFAAGQRTPDRHPPVPRWDGTDLAGRSLFVWPEQGLGDEIRFASCLHDVVEAADRVIVECNERLVPLFRRSFPEAEVRAESIDRLQPAETHRFDGIDAHVPIGSLPIHLRRSNDQFPDAGGFLLADARRRQHWRQRLDALGPGPKVGICWRSMNLKTSRLRNYTTLEEWLPALRLPGLTFVSLQYGAADQHAAELTDLEGRFGIVVHRWDDLDYTSDIEGVAALTSELDAVVGVSGFGTILSGALGTPTLVLNTPTAWTLGRERDPWFPTVRHLFRGWDESWERPVHLAAEALEGHLPRTR